MFGPAPKPPPVLHTAPRAGVVNPQFPNDHPPTTKAPYPEFDANRNRQLEPQGVYESVIDTHSPVDAGTRAKISRVTSAWSNPTTANIRSLSMGDSGAKSISAMNRALSDMSRNALSRGTEQFETQYRTEAEQSRSEDIQSQRGNTFDRFKMDVMKAIYDADTWSRWSSSKSDIKAHYERELANSKSIVTQAVIRGMMSML